MARQFISYSRQQKALEEIAELDTVVEEKKKELKKQKDIDSFKEKVKDIATTKEESQKEIDLWLGLYVPTKDWAKILKALILFMLICFVTFMVIENNIIKLIAIILFIISSAIGITAIFSFAEYEDKEALQKNRYEQLKEKTLSTDYTLDEGVIDCPIEVKKDLLDRLDKGFVYLSVGFGANHLYYYKEDGYTEEHPSRIYSNEYEYFKDQLTEYKLYKISDIIMDIAER